MSENINIHLFELARMDAKLKAIERLVEEWETMLPHQFFFLIKAILENDKPKNEKN